MSSRHKQVRVVHLLHRFDTGGMENGVVNLINHLDSQRFHHTIIAFAGINDQFARRLKVDVELFSLDKKPGQDVGVYIRLWKMLRALQPDIVHSRNLSTIEGQISAWLAKVPYRIHSEHGWDVFDPRGEVRKYQLLRKAISALVHRLVPLSSELERYLVDKVGVPGHKIRRICNGVDSNRFTPEKNLRDGAESDHAHKILRVGTVGRLEAIKGQEVLVKAFAQLPEDIASKVRLEIVGDGSRRPGLVQLVQELGLETSIEFLGNRSDVDSIIRNLDLFVLPSHAEGISNTILEAMSSGVAVIATDVGGNPDLVLNGATGLIVPRDDPAAMANAISQYVSSQAMLVDHGKAARERVLEKFSIDSMVKNYEALYLAGV